MTRKVLIITGASRGIGAATALLAGQQGYDVCLAYVSQGGAAAQLVAQLESGGARASAVRCDVASEADILALFETVDRTFGRLDALVNNAGITGRPGPAASHEAADVERLLRVNVLGTLLCAREAVKRMSTKSGGQGGAIVNLGSIASRLGAPHQATHYAASKGAIDAYTRGLAREVADQGIRVNQVSPGFIATDMLPTERRDAVAKLVPMGRLGDVQEVAQTILWLLSDAAPFVTAANVDVSGGR